MSSEVIKLILAGIIFIIFILVAVLAYMYFKEQKQKRADKAPQKVNSEIDEKKAKDSIFKFMEFDNIEDNMISEDNGKKYLMVIECKGVNYDLLSNVEKTSIEQGFLEFLNALKFEVQLYIQTRKVNLAQSTAAYRARLKNIEIDMRNEEMKYQDMQRNGNYTKDEILKEIKEVTKKRNLYEYGKDVIENTEQMSQDSDLTTKEYYVIVPYYTDEITSAGDYDKKEIASMAFSELYTRAQTIVSSLSECDVRGRILNSQELVELLYVAYNREQHDIYDFEEYMSESGYDSLYSVAEDVLQKRIVALDEEITKKANEKAINAYRIASKKTEAMKKAIADREKRMQEYIDSLANKVIDSEAKNIGDNMVKLAKDEVKNMTEETKKKLKRNEEQNNVTQSIDNNDDINIINTDIQNKQVNKIEEKPKRQLTEEEIRRRRAILRRRKLLKEREEQKNAKNSDE